MSKKIINPKAVDQALEVAENICKESLVSFFADYSDTDMELNSYIYATLGTMMTRIERDPELFKLENGEEEEEEPATTREKIKAGDVDGEKKAVAEIGCKLCDMLAEYTDDFSCVKEILVNLIEVLASGFGIRKETITWLIKNANS